MADMTLSSLVQATRTSGQKVDWMVCFYVYTITLLMLTNAGHFVAHLRLIFRPITTLSYSESYLAYVERLDVVTLDDSTGMYILRRARRANNDRIGDVIPITQIVAPIHLIPRFGPKADPQLTMQSSINHATEFYLNKFWNKELFFALHVTSR
jgi:hypothetical protein